SLPNRSNSSPRPFLLTGIPELEALHVWISIPFCITYITALLGNSLVLPAVILDRNLHEPMYYFIAVLAVIDLIFSTAAVPKMLGVFWVGCRESGFEACFTQTFFIHTFTAVGSGALLALSLDRYVAVCSPLRYQTILSVQAVAQMGLAIVLRALLVMVPLTGLVTALPYCGSRLVPHSYCEHLAVAKLACADPAPAGRYSVAGSSLIVGMDVAFIAVSYGMILRAVLGHKSRRKALSTCGCHLSVVLLFYLPGIVSIYAQHFGSAVPVPAQVLLADLYVTLPTMLNPLVYSMRSRPIRQALLRML
ncbi:O52I1 protein, partial [Piprites chloris]|nr:O52I1 protein [Piprites chloris]